MNVEERQTVFCNDVGERQGWMEIVNEVDEVLQLIEREWCCANYVIKVTYKEARARTSIVLENELFLASNKEAGIG